MRILVIAPDTPTLPGVDGEINAIDSAHDTVVLAGTVREVDIAEAIRGSAPFDVIWFILHGGSEGVEISNGVVININGIGQYVVASGAHLCVLNSCSSEDAARQIVVGSKAGIVYSISNVADTEATRFGSLFAVELAKTSDIEVAFNAARPKRGDYRYLPAGVVLRAMDLTLSGRVDTLQSNQERNSQKIYELVVDTRSIKEETAAVRATLDKLRGIVESERGMTENDRVMRTWLIGLTVLEVVNLFGTLTGILRSFGGGG